MVALEELKKTISPDDRQSRQAIDFIEKTAGKKLDNFYFDFCERARNPDDFREEIVPRKVYYRNYYYYVNVGAQASSRIGEVVDSFLSDDPKQLDGFKAMVKLSLDSLLGSAAAGESETKKWFVGMDHGTLIRVDCLAWRYNFEGNELANRVENAFCFTVTKAFVDITEIYYEKLLAFVAKSLNLPSLDEVRASDETIHTYMNSIWNRYMELPRSERSAEAVEAAYINRLTANNSQPLASGYHFRAVAPPDLNYR